MTAPVVGVVGLGQMGLPIARRVLGAGFPLSFYSRHSDVVAELNELGATDGGSLEGVAAMSSIVVVCVYTDEQVDDVCLGRTACSTIWRPGPC